MALSYREESTEYAPPPKHGHARLIFTNLHLLAGKLEVDEQILITIFDEFIQQKREYGISYKLIDAGNYSYQKSVFWGNTKKAHLKANSPLWDYMDILMDVHQRGTGDKR